MVCRDRLLVIQTKDTYEVTIRSIVNGLRADDAESFYPRRGSFESELSTSAPHDVSGGEQLFFKEHARAGSKGSVTSNFGRRRSQIAARPETKVSYSSICLEIPKKK